MPISSYRQIITVLIGTNILTCVYARTYFNCFRYVEKRNKSLIEMTQYMVNLFEKYDIPLDEFDAIVLNTMMKEHNGTG